MAIYIYHNNNQTVFTIPPDEQGYDCLEIHTLEDIPVVMLFLYLDIYKFMIKLKVISVSKRCEKQIQYFCYEVETYLITNV